MLVMGFPKDENRETEVSGFRFFVSGFGRFVKFRVFSREYPVKTHEVKGLWKRRVWEYEKDGAQSVKKPLLIIIKGHYNDKFLWLTLPEIDYLCSHNLTMLVRVHQ